MFTRKFSSLYSCACVGLLVLPGALYADDHPSYAPESQRVFIPSIDTTQQQGAYQNATLEFVQGDLWRLKDFSVGSDIPGVEKVRLIQTDSFPVQVFLEVDGWLSGCGKLDLGQRRVDDTFEISIQWAQSPRHHYACLAVVEEFSWIVPLPVYGLAAGEYHYVVNDGKQFNPVMPQEPQIGGGGTIGSFVLEEDNIFERAAPEFPRKIDPEISQATPAP